MATDITMPRLSDSMEEGTILKWMVSEGDEVEKGQEIAEIELFILRRMKEFTLGDHASVFKGSGFNFVGIRDWEPGDRMSNIDWAQSSLNNFSPMITREFEQDSNAAIVAVADASLSTRCGTEGDLIATAIARAVAAAGLSATFSRIVLVW